MKNNEIEMMNNNEVEITLYRNFTNTSNVRGYQVGFFSIFVRQEL